MFRGASALEPHESEMTEPTKFDPVTDEIRRWSSHSVFQKTNTSGLSVSRMVY
jgi:hypothetical protein